MKLPLLKPKTHIQIARQNLTMNYTSKKISESQYIPNTPNLPEESSEQNTDLQKTKIPEIDVQPLIEELRIEPL
ncbi:2331_t:CDS:1, partial [Acaulospora colombiana]